MRIICKICVCGQATRFIRNKMAENVVDPLMQPEIILTENDVPGAKLTKDLAECNVDELKCWLKCRGQKKDGRKAELVARVEDLLKLMDCLFCREISQKIAAE